MLAHNRHPRFLHSVIVDFEPYQYAVHWNSVASQWVIDPHLVLYICRSSGAFSQWRLQEVWLFTSENLPHFCCRHRHERVNVAVGPR